MEFHINVVYIDISISQDYKSWDPFLFSEKNRIFLSNHIILTLIYFF